MRMKNTVVITKPLRLVDSSVAWPAVAACVEFRGECRCYGDEGERLDVSEDDAFKSVFAWRIYDDKGDF